MSGEIQDYFSEHLTVLKKQIKVSMYNNVHACTCVLFSNKCVSIYAAWKWNFHIIMVQQKWSLNALLE